MLFLLKLMLNKYTFFLLCNLCCSFTFNKKNYRLRLFFTFIVLHIFSVHVFAQITVRGSIFDKSKVNYIEAVTVYSTGGNIAYTDSLGRYAIEVKQHDSLYFFYKNKPTQKFAISTITNTEQFDIALQTTVKSKYGLLKEVVVYTKNYKYDSAENRERYAKIFEYKKPGISTSINPSGTVGLDANELINIFRFRRNKQLRKFQLWLEKDEQEKYVNYRFSKNFVRRITQIKGAALDTFLVWYRPSYYFTSIASEIEFNEYILEASYVFKKIYKELIKMEGKKERE
jgi:hypothetical protein